MRHATLRAKPTRWSAARIQQDAASRAHGISLTPPTYGMDWVDRASVEAGRVRPAGAVSIHPAPSTLRPPTRTPEQVHAPNAQEAEPGARQVGSPPSTLPLQRQEPQDDEERLHQPPSTTGLPEHLKAGIETLSGMPVDDVTVHYNSSNPAQVQALAYTHGAEIYVGPGAARHLSHEAWHIVQQRQGRVPPISQANGVAINDDAGLEKEADVMGLKALRMTRVEPVAMGSVYRGVTSLQRSGKITAKRQERERPLERPGNKGVGMPSPLVPVLLSYNERGTLRICAF